MNDYSILHLIIHGKRSIKFSTVLEKSDRLLESWIGVTSGRFDPLLLKASVKEYQTALMLVLIGHYRSAFVSLRQFLEMLLAYVHFSANEYDYKRWSHGENDIVWKGLIDEDRGVLSINFARAFFDELSNYAPQYKTIAERVYRECSEFVHGNASVQPHLGGALEFDQTLFQAWNEKSGTVRMLSMFALVCRYGKALNAKEIRQLESAIADELGHVEQVRSLLELS
jgi:hypothetical protein